MALGIMGLGLRDGDLIMYAIHNKIPIYPIFYLLKRDYSLRHSASNARFEHQRVQGLEYFAKFI